MVAHLVFVRFPDAVSDNATFHGKFRGCSVVVTADYAAFRRTQDISQCISQQWRGTPTPRIVPDYIAWMHTVMCEIAQRVNERIFYAYAAGGAGGAKYFYYHPDGTYEEDDPLDDEEI